MIVFAMVLMLFRQIDADTLTLNDTEYARMPPILKMDPYEPCIGQASGVYCDVKLTLVSDTPSQLQNMIHEYSAYTQTHFNHSKLHYFVCVTKSCSEYYNNATVKDLRSIIEACLNKSLWNTYHLKARVSKNVSCGIRKKDINIGVADIIVAAICLAILLINIIGSLCDAFLTNDKSKGLQVLFCFSMLRNWNKFITISQESTDPRSQQLKGIHGIRVITTYLVIIVHSIFPWYLYGENTRFIEELYFNPVVKVFLGASLAMQTFLVMSGLLLIHKIQRFAEKNEISWSMVPKFLLIRWLRLTPPYALVLGLTATWLRFASFGPRWQEIVGAEAQDCRQYWWLHLLYLNNYIDGSQCMNQSWYLATDTQLYCVGLLVYVVCRSIRLKTIVLSLLLVVGMIAPALHTYLQNLDPLLILRPESAAKLLFNDPVFDHVYKRGHTNLPGYVIGLSVGYLVYHWQTSGFNVKKLQTYRILYWALFPLVAGVTYSGSVFFRGGPRAPALVNALYAGLIKPIFSALIAALLLGMIMKIESVYRGLLEWRWLRYPSRLTYSAYLWHVAYIRTSAALHTTTLHVSFIQMVENAWMTLGMAFLAAFIFWLLVEAPLANLMKHLTDETKPEESNTTHEVEKSGSQDCVIRL